MKTYPRGTITLIEHDRKVIYEVNTCPFCGAALEHKYSSEYRLVEKDHSPTVCRFSLSDLTSRTSRLINFSDSDGWDVYFIWDNDGDLWAFLPYEERDNGIGHNLRPVGKKLLKAMLNIAIKFHQDNLNNCLAANNILDNKE